MRTQKLRAFCVLIINIEGHELTTVVFQVMVYESKTVEIETFFFSSSKDFI